MILACPFCHTRYLISANVFALGPRQVRCARCGHSWQADVPPEVDPFKAPPVIDLTPTPEVIAPIPPGSNLPVLRSRLSPRLKLGLEIGAGVIVCLLLGTFIFMRQSVVEIWPSFEGFYDSIGLHIYHYGEGLNLEKVRSELRYEGGRMNLVVEGKIHNASANIQAVPAIQAIAIGADGKPIQSWQIDPPQPKMAQDETIAVPIDY